MGKKPKEGVPPAIRKYMAELGRRSGIARQNLFDTAHYQRIGREGAAKRWKGHVSNRPQKQQPFKLIENEDSQGSATTTPSV